MERYTKYEIEGQLLIEGKSYPVMATVCGMTDGNETWDVCLEDNPKLSEIIDPEDFSADIVRQFHEDAIDSDYDKAKERRIG